MQTKKFLDPESVLFKAGLASGSTVVDLGAGSGFFAISSSKIVGAEGHVYVVDVLETSLEHVAAAARIDNLRNLQTIRADLEKDSLDQIPSGKADLVILANIIHQIKDLPNLMKLTYRMLKTGGKLLVVDWSEAPVAIGPKHENRVSDEEVKSAAIKVSLSLSNTIETDPYHYGLVFTK